ncbi:unnamed protein product, partial [Owenia fusiformis]
MATELFYYVKGLLKKASKLLCEEVDCSDAVSTLKTTLPIIRLMYDWRIVDPRTTELAGRGGENALTGSCTGRLAAVMELCRSLTPHRLLDQLISTVHLASANKTQGREEVPRRGISRNTDLSLDSDEDMMETGVDEVNEFESLNSADKASQDEETPQSSGVQCLLDTDLLSELQGIKLQCVDILAAWCSYDRTLSSEPTSIDYPLECSAIREKLLELLDPGETWDCTKSFDLQLLQQLANTFSNPSQYLNEEDLGFIIGSLKDVFTKHSSDQEICEVFSRLLAKLIYRLKPQVGQPRENLSETQNLALGLVKIFWELQEKGKYASKVRLATATCMKELIQHDPSCEWSKWSVREDDEDENVTMVTVLVHNEFPDTFMDQQHSLQMYTAHNIKHLFGHSTEEGWEAFNKTRQLSAFKKVLERLDDMMNIEEKKSDEERADELHNKTSVFLHALATIATHSDVCEKQPLYAVINSVEESNTDITLVKKVLCEISRLRGYKNFGIYMQSHLSYILHRWLDNHKLHIFPYQLANCTSLENFFRCNYQAIVPYLAMNRDQTGLKALCDVIQTTPEDLLLECTPRILVHILPLFAANKHCSLKGKEVNQATKCYDWLIKQITVEAVKSCILKHMDEIVVDILMTLYDPGNSNTGKEDTSAICPEPNPPFYSREIVTATLEYLKENHSSKAGSIVSLLARTHDDGIQKVLLSLRVSLSTSHWPHERLRFLQMYTLFTGLLLQEFEDQLGNSWAFVLRDVTYTLLHTIERLGNREPQCVAMAVDLLISLCKVTVQCCPQGLGLLKLLVLDNADVLQKGISLLPPFPSDGQFDTLQAEWHRIKYKEGAFTLKQELLHFLEGQDGCHETTGQRLEGLVFLRQRLETDKAQLATLVAECEEKKTECVLIRLVQELCDISASPNSKICLEAAKCLGEIGPTDLSVVAMTENHMTAHLESAMTVYKDNPIMQRNCQIFHILSSYLIDSCVETVVASSAVLKALLATQAGAKFAASYKQNIQDYLFNYLYPFRTSKKKVIGSSQQEVNDEKFLKCIDDLDLWCPGHDDHNTWLITLVTSLIESTAVTDGILQHLTNVCKVKVAFCEMVLPFLIHNILQAGNQTHREVISSQMRHFFSQHCSRSEEISGRVTTPQPCSSSTRKGGVCMNKRSVRTLLSVVQYLRTQDRPKQKKVSQTAWENNFWLDINYLQLAQAAHNSTNHFSALLYTEIHCCICGEESGSSSEGGSSRSISQGSENAGTSLESLSSLQGGISVQALLLEAYKCVGDPDGVYGCGAGRLAETSARIRTYEHEDKWGKALSAYDLEMSHPITATQLGLLHSLQKFGVSHVLETYLQGLVFQGLDQTPEIQHFQYETSWKNCNWTLDTPSRLDEKCGFNEGMYSSLCAILDKDQSRFHTAIDMTRHSAICALGQGSMESARCLYSSLATLQSVNETQHTGEALFNVLGTNQLLQQWKQQDICLMNDYEFLEEVMITRSVLLRVCHQQRPRDVTLYKGLMEHLEKQACFARQASRLQVGERCMALLRETEREELGVVWSWRLEEARLYWARQETDTAKHILTNLLQKLEQAKDVDKSAALLYPLALGIYGNWLAETRSENPTVIMDQYLERAVKLWENPDIKESRSSALDAYLSLARFSDTQYQSIVSYMKSSTFESKQTHLRKAKTDAQKLSKSMSNDKSVKRFVQTLKKQSQIDDAELKSLVKDKQRFLLSALLNSLKCLQYGDTHDLRVFRMTSLWFDNAANDEIIQLISERIHNIKTYKFLPLMYQLAARMSMRALGNPLDRLIERTAMEHPYHTLYIILALANANKDDELTPGAKTAKHGSTSKSTNNSQEHEEEDRVCAARSMVERLRATGRGDIISRMEGLCEAYIQLANWDVDQYKQAKKAVPLHKDLMFTKLIKQQHFTDIAVPTIDIKIDPTGQYNNIVELVEVRPTFTLAGGINLPKILEICGSDGKWRRQLTKGRDDLRQDAVMQQVFSMVNSLLLKYPDTKQRKLTVRTYKVVPLSQRSGILEWCEGTMPIGEYLIGTNGAHPRYRAQDWPALKCRKTLQEATVEEKYEAYTRICQHFQPVFRHFFFESFKEPSKWYERRLAYTHSVATNSIVGYILGLGDRHVQNILIDRHTAELVHIDLGVAFEQGKILPTPETVPFRLTRDIVDGMGIAGVEGVFRRCCESTMKVMHQNNEALLTILQ